jgi:hypothetical protein
MRIVERNDLRIGYVISYSYPNTDHVSHGTIVHLGLGLATRHAVWVRCLEGSNKGKVECILLEYATGVTFYASR